jgi:hypothetical protein
MLERSKAFFGDRGFSFDPAFTDETAACMLVGEHAFVMLLSRENFAEFARLPTQLLRPRRTRLGRSCGWIRRRRSRGPEAFAGGSTRQAAPSARAMADLPSPRRRAPPLGDPAQQRRAGGHRRHAHAPRPPRPRVGRTSPRRPRAGAPPDHAPAPLAHNHDAGEPAPPPAHRAHADRRSRRPRAGDGRRSAVHPAEPRSPHGAVPRPRPPPEPQRAHVPHRAEPRRSDP